MFRYRLSSGYAACNHHFEEALRDLCHHLVDQEADRGTVECVTTGRTLAEVNIYEDPEAAPIPGEGDAPVAWTDQRNMDYLKRGSGAATVWPTNHGASTPFALYTRPNTATPEGLREAVTVIRDLLADEADGDPVQRAKDFLAALQLQAQGGE